MTARSKDDDPGEAHTCDDCGTIHAPGECPRAPPTLDWAKANRDWDRVIGRREQGHE